MAVVAEVAGGLARLQRAVPALDSFPCVQVPAHSADAAYPHLGWQPRAARVAVQRLTAHRPWLLVRPNHNMMLYPVILSPCPWLAAPRRASLSSAWLCTGPGCWCTNHCSLDLGIFAISLAGSAAP